MLIYGDHNERAAPEERARDINDRLRRAALTQCGFERHTELVAALVEGGRLLQAIADADFRVRRCDRRTEATDELSGVLLTLGCAIRRSWDSGFEDAGTLPRLEPRFDWAGELELRTPEGYAYYALYPEAYIEAARRLKLTAAPRVIGIRSIGTSLAAVVAGALDAPSAVTIRPCGDPFQRTIAVDPELERNLLAGDPHYVIVDEGPGQSGSSFAAVADWLQGRGVPSDRIALLTSHAGAPGSAAVETRRRWWSAVQREAGDFGDTLGSRLAEWSRTVLGPLDADPEEISGGAWRRLRSGGEQDCPPVVSAWERRKYIVRARGEPFLAKFAGLGRIGEQKLVIARTLHSEKLVPEPLGLAHGFLIERWYEDAAPLQPHEKPLTEIARYLGMRSRLLPAPRNSGANIEDLFVMIRRNLSVESGDRFAALLEPFVGRTGELECAIFRVRTDNKVERQEWLRTSRGVLTKTDALDHHQAHDLIGCQDMAWDVAGVITEFKVDPEAVEGLVCAVEEWSTRLVDRPLLAFYRIAYLAFRLGQMRLGRTMASEADERTRIDRDGDYYAAELQHLLEGTRARLGTNP